MNITVNGQNHEFQTPLNAAQLLEALGLSKRRVALEVNGRIVPASERSRCVLNEADCVEVVQAIGGG